MDSPVENNTTSLFRRLTLVDFFAYALAPAIRELGHLAGNERTQYGPDYLRLVIDSPHIFGPADVFFLSDFHLGPHFANQKFIHQTFCQLSERIARAALPMVILGGDFVDERLLRFPETPSQDFQNLLAQIATLKATFPDLLVGHVTGNHDPLHTRWETFNNMLTCSGVVSLENGVVNFPDVGLEIIGLPDFKTSRSENAAQPDWDLIQTPPSGLRIIVAHDPASNKQIARISSSHPDRTIVINGHTHRGQHTRQNLAGKFLRTLGMIGVGFAPQYLNSITYEENAIPAIVSSGIGRSPNSASRTLSPEIVHLLLRPSSILRY